MATNTSPRCKTSDTVDIQPVSPAVNQLDTKEGNIGSITRLTLGERDPTKINKTILLVGKSTLINALVNYAMGVKYEDNVWYQIVEDEKKSQAESQTSDVIVYEKGLTRCPRQRKIVGLVRSTDGVREIDAVCLVLKASDNRLSDRLMYVFDSVVSLFGKDIEKNIVALITHSDFLTPKNVLQALKDAKIRCAKNEKGQPVHFLFNNRQKTEKNEDNEAQIEHIWNSTMKQISKFAGFLQNTEPQNLKTTIEERVQFIELKQREIKQTQKGLKKHEQDMKNNKDFKIEVDIVSKKKKNLSMRLDGGGQNMELPAVKSVRRLVTIHARWAWIQSV
ncbi:hypothetical protein F7725_021269 [Dissostichus mawsoni]|uniref:AIG1-type G domain-containing protein n=1 Tax=Dissostichus mawsoni TaxID=36200 RepID=A0A7J5YH07_DISMA|nr:hypothetical protein F7725_021269 [Dissostichus mawsoni]